MYTPFEGPSAHLRWKLENNHWRIEHVMVADIGMKPLKPVGIEFIGGVEAYVRAGDGLLALRGGGLAVAEPR